MLQFNEEFYRLRPGAKNFLTEWQHIAPLIVKFAHVKRDDADIDAILSELENGGQAMNDRSGNLQPTSGMQNNS